MSENKNTATEGEKTATEAKQNRHEMVKIKLPKTRELCSDVFVSVNNYTCLIKRGVEVEVPYFVKEVLDHSEEMKDKRLAFEENAKR